MSVQQKLTHKLIAFHIPTEMNVQLKAAAVRYGFRSPSAYVRALTERMIDNPPPEIDTAMRRIGEMRVAIQYNFLRRLGEMISTLTVEDLVVGEGEDE